MEGGKGVDAPSGQTVETPDNLYELLGVDQDATDAELKKAYYKKMKVCHPDIAGDEAEEMCILLNESYEMLSDPEGRAAYDEQVRAENPGGNAIKKYTPVDPDDLKPTWQWTPKRSNRDLPPEWMGRPFSRSQYDKVPPESRGRKWDQEQFVYVDEWSCIACRNCCDVAPRTFCIDMDAGRARAYTQWGNSEEDLDYAVAACPVDCIYWVSRDELQVLEYVTRDRMHETGNSLPCPMSARQGNGNALEDPFGMAQDFQQRMKAKEEKLAGNVANFNELARSANKVRERIAMAFGQLTNGLKLRGWGGFS